MPGAASMVEAPHDAFQLKELLVMSRDGMHSATAQQAS